MANRTLKIHAQVNFVTVSSEEDTVAYHAGISMLLKWMIEEKQKEITEGRNEIMNANLTGEFLEEFVALPAFENAAGQQRVSQLGRLHTRPERDQSPVYSVAVVSP